MDYDSTGGLVAPILMQLPLSVRFTMIQFAMRVRIESLALPLKVLGFIFDGGFVVRINPFLISLAVNILITSAPNFASSAPLCMEVLSSFENKRNIVDTTIDWSSDLSVLRGLQRSVSLGLVKTYFSKEWNTQVYYTATGLPNAKGQAPLVDPESRGVFIFSHGSGTMKSSGKNFVANMNNLAKLGFSTIAVDMPYHANGPRDPLMNNAFHFMEWIKEIVTQARTSGKPIYLVGHSFGPDVILEFAARYPKLVDGVVALSPASFNKVLEKWYQNYTTKMKFGGDVSENEAGGTWAATVSKGFLWSTGRLADPTVINPKLKIRILSGDHEDYVPAPIDPVTYLPIGKNTYDVSKPLQLVMKNAVITIEPGIGHYLFEYMDEKGNNVVNRELLAAVGIEMSKYKELAEALSQANQNQTSSVQLQKKYAQDELFKAWADQKYGPGKVLKIAKQQSDSFSTKILSEYSLAMQARFMEIYKKIMATKESAPEFYAKYNVGNYNPNKLDMSLFYPYLINVLNGGI